MKDRLIVTVLIASLLSFGCVSYTSKIGPISVKQPVMLGKIQNINGMTIVPGKQKHEFDISRYHGRYEVVIFLGPCSPTYKPLDDIYDKSNQAVELEKYILAPDDLIKIDNVYFRSSFVFIPITLILYFEDRVTTGVQGNVYENNSGKKSEKINLE